MKRPLAVFIVLAFIGAPAMALRLLCVGEACRSQAQATESTPFCSLPRPLRQQITNGFRDKRSPEVLAVSARSAVLSGVDGTIESAWPSTANVRPQVPIMFWGEGVTQGANLPAGVGLDDIAPTIAELIDLERPHADVRSGKLVKEAVSSAEVPRLVIQFVWKNVGSDDIGAATGRLPEFSSLVEEGASTFAGELGSLPADPVANITTIGTGGVPSQHGITGSLLRNDSGDLVEAWGQESPGTVIATLADHLDELYQNRALISLVGKEPSDRGLIGGDWFPDGDLDLVSLLSRRSGVPQQTSAAIRLLEGTALGKDVVPDVLGIVQEGPIQELDLSLGKIVRAASRAAPGKVLVVVAGTGPGDLNRLADSVSASMVARRVEAEVPGPAKVIEGLVPGGFFLDQDELSTLKISDDAVVEPLRTMRASNEPIFADVFPGIAVTFGRYC